MRDLLIGIAVGGLVVAVVMAQWSPANVVVPAVAQPVRPDVGRYQIVNGTPDLAANIMLLDTITGDSWVKCSSPDTGSLWCRMSRSDSGTEPRPRP